MKEFSEGERDHLNQVLDPGIRAAVIALREAGVDTFESCEGGTGHCYPVPTVRFAGDINEGMRAVRVVRSAGLPVDDLHMTWSVIEEKIAGPWLELTFYRRPAEENGNLVTENGVF